MVLSSTLIPYLFDVQKKRFRGASICYMNYSIRVSPRCNLRNNDIGDFNHIRWACASFFCILNRLGRVLQIMLIGSLLYQLSFISIIFRLTSLGPHFQSIAFMAFFLVMHLYQTMLLIKRLHSHRYGVHCTQHSSLNHRMHLAFVLACYQHFIWSSLVQFTSNSIMTSFKVLLFL